MTEHAFNTPLSIAFSRMLNSHGQQSVRGLLVAALVALGVTACATLPEGSVTSTPAEFAPALRDQATLPPPAWVEGAEEVTLTNAPRIAYIGRLDAASTPSTVFAHSFSPDGTRLAGLNNEQLIAWDLITGQIIFNTAREDSDQVFYSPDKLEIYTIDAVGELLIYDADVGREKDTINSHPQFNGVAAYYADEGWLALGGLDGTVKVWDMEARQSRVTLETGGRGTTALAFSADGTQLVTGNQDSTIQVWDWANRTMTTQFQGVANRVAFSPDGDLVAAGQNTTIILWNIPESKQAFSIPTGPGGSTEILEFSPDGDFVMNGGAGPSTTIWDTATGQLVNTLPGVGGDRTSSSFSTDGTLLATSVLGGTASLWDMSQIRGEMLNRADLNTGTPQILEVDWSSDGHVLLLFDATGPIQVWGVPAEAESATE